MKSKPLVLRQETKLHCLLPAGDGIPALEASGLIKVGEQLYVVFDNRLDVARLHASLAPETRNCLIGPSEYSPPFEGYEGLAWDACRKRFLLLVEAHGKKQKYRSEIVEYREDGTYHSSRPLDFPFKCKNKGFESIHFEGIDRQRRLWALCESNGCKCGKKGRRPGKGRIQVFTAGKHRWKHVDTVKLPKSVGFQDYSAFSVRAGRVAVASQEDSLLWVGRFDQTNREWLDEGKLFHFPHLEGKVCYGNIEGLAWLSKRRIYAVSDRIKSDQSDAEAAKDQSIHIFEIPR